MNWNSVTLLILCLVLAPAIHGDQSHGLILLYHHVSDETPANTSVTPEQFEAHLTYIEENGYHVIELATMLDDLSNGKPVPDNSVAITFDDGYVSVLREAAPALSRRDFPFTVFISTAQVGKGSLFLDWPELKGIQQLGGRVANHGLHHGHMAGPQPNESRATWRTRVKQEISQAQLDIERKLGDAPAMFAYPYGEYSHDLQDIVASLDLHGLAQHSGAVGWQSNFLAIPRHPFHTRAADLARLAERLQTKPLTVHARPASGVIVQGASLQVEVAVKTGPYHLNRLSCFFRGQAITLPVAKTNDGHEFTIALEDLEAGRNTWICTAPADPGPGYAWWSYLVIRHDQ